MCVYVRVSDIVTGSVCFDLIFIWCEMWNSIEAIHKNILMEWDGDSDGVTEREERRWRVYSIRCDTFMECQILTQPIWWTFLCINRWANRTNGYTSNIDYTLDGVALFKFTLNSGLNLFQNRNEFRTVHRKHDVLAKGGSRFNLQFDSKPMRFMFRVPCDNIRQCV